MGFFGIKQHFADVLTQVITDAADDDIAFLINQEGRVFLLRSVGNRCPQRQQIVEVPLQFFLVFTDSGGAHDDAHAVWNVQAVDGLTDF